MFTSKAKNCHFVETAMTRQKYYLIKAVKTVQLLITYVNVWLLNYVEIVNLLRRWDPVYKNDIWILLQSLQASRVTFKINLIYTVNEVINDAILHDIDHVNMHVNINEIKQICLTFIFL